MKRLLLLLLVPVISFAKGPHYSNAQMLIYLKWGPTFELGYNFSQEMYYGSKREVMLVNKVQTVRSYNLNKRGKKTSWYERTYDTSGRMVRMKTEKDDVKYVFTDTLVTEIHRMTKNNTKYDTKIVYDAEARITKFTLFKNGKATEETNYVYFDQQKISLVEKKFFGKKGKTYRLETDYDDLLKSPSEARYIINGELKKRWTYTCEQKGKLEKKKIEEVTQCNYSASNNDGSYIFYTRTIEDGRDVLQESTYSKDSVLIEHKSFIKDSILVSHSTYSKERTVSEGFNKHGKRTYKFIREDDKNGNAVKYINYFSRTDKKPSITSLVYSDGNLIQEVTYARGAKVQFDYTYY